MPPRMRLLIFERRRVLSSICILMIGMGAGFGKHYFEPSKGSAELMRPCQDFVYRSSLGTPSCFLPPGVTASHLRGIPALMMGLAMDLNEVNAEELRLVPGIGPRLSERIIEDRTENGEFGDLEELTRVRGIGPKLQKRAARLLRVEGRRKGRANP